MNFQSSKSHGDGYKSAGRSFEYAQNTSSAIIVFLGSCVTFSDRLLRTVAFEFDDVEVLRLHSLDEMHGLDERTRRAVRLVLVDEDTVGLLPQTADGIDQATLGVGAVLAYRSRSKARRVLKAAYEAEIDNQLRFLPMKAPLDAWLAALRLLILGEAFMPSELFERPGNRPTPAVGDMHDAATGGTAPQKISVEPPTTLTARELQVLELVADGLPNKSIAKNLGLSEHTVKLHVHHIFGKLGVQNRTSASTWFLAHYGNSG
ncbi:helix-turn-helix transcriptional regulator [Litoreibacter arenae]|uniref:helix-turn-helix transcriptional regulator n=1 Tax=Litoreibacter arenae TaxID=491388 RepID=UPI0012B5F4DA|nr:response regulator transcription factor [Litoreibacter arenae]